MYSVAGIYISWPFCAQKCTYCNFASGVFPRELESRYLNALLKEISAHRFTWAPETLYIGGGTPSGMGTEAIANLRDAFPATPWREATLESAPGTLTADRIKAWQLAGINRVSLGVQSFVKSELSRTGRKHDAQIVAAGYCHVARSRHSQHQHRSDRRPSWPDRNHLARVSRRRPGSRTSHTSPYTCWRSMRTAVSVPKFSSAVNATARPMCRLTIRLRISMSAPSTCSNPTASIATRSQISRAPAPSRSTI